MNRRGLIGWGGLGLCWFGAMGPAALAQAALKGQDDCAHRVTRRVAVLSKDVPVVLDGMAARGLLPRFAHVEQGTGFSALDQIATAFSEAREYFRPGRRHQPIRNIAGFQDTSFGDAFKLLSEAQLQTVAEETKGTVSLPVLRRYRDNPKRYWAEIYALQPNEGVSMTVAGRWMAYGVGEVQPVAEEKALVTLSQRRVLARPVYVMGTGWAKSLVRRHADLVKTLPAGLRTFLNVNGVPDGSTCAEALLYYAGVYNGVRQLFAEQLGTQTAPVDSIAPKGLFDRATLARPVSRRQVVSLLLRKNR